MQIWKLFSIDDLSTDLTFEYMQKIAACDSRFFVKRRETKGGNAVKALEYFFTLIAMVNTIFLCLMMI